MSNNNLPTKQDISNNNIAVKSPSNTLQLSTGASIDLSGLTESQIQEIKFRHAENMMNLADKYQEMKMDIGTLGATLDQFNMQTERASQSGTFATFSHSRTTSIGRTEVLIGNTQKAASGKLSRTATGESSNLLQIVIIIAVALVLIAIFGGK